MILGLARVSGMLFEGPAANQNQTTQGPQISGEVMVAAAIMLIPIKWACLQLRQKVIYGTTNDICTRAVTIALQQDTAYFKSTSSSKILAVLQNAQIFAFYVLSPLATMASAVVVGCAVLAGMFAVDARSTLTAGALLTSLYWVSSRISRRGIESTKGDIASTQQTRLQILQEAIGAIKELKILRREEIAVTAFAQEEARYRTAQGRIRIHEASPRIIIESALILAIASISILVQDNRINSAEISTLAVVLYSAQRLLPQLQAIYSSKTLMGSAGTVLVDLNESLNLPTQRVAPDSQLQTSDIQLHNITFSHPGESSPTIEHLSASITASELTTITGPSGSGKSTLLELIIGLEEPDGGRITMTTGSVHDDPRSRQSVTAYVPQKVFLYDASIQFNITFCNDTNLIDQEALATATHAAQLTEFLESTALGLQTQVGEAGSLISGGQAQRIGIARAIYTKRPIIALDEATSALDPETEAKLLRAIKELKYQPTILLVTHSMSAAGYSQHNIDLAPNNPHAD